MRGSTGSTRSGSGRGRGKITLQSSTTCCGQSKSRRGRLTYEYRGGSRRGSPGLAGFGGLICYQQRRRHLLTARRGEVGTSWNAKRGGLRCKNYFQARMLIEYVLLCGDPEQRSDEGRLPSRVASG